MNIQDFLSTENLMILLPIAVLLLILLCLVISFSIIFKSSKKKIDEITNSMNSLRVYIIDTNNDCVRYFNRSRLQRKKSSSITAFYNQFKASDRSLVIDWIGNLLNNFENTPKFLEVNVLFSYNKKSYFSILQVSKVDLTKGVIYLESYILKYMYAVKTKDSNLRKFVSKEKLCEIIKTNRQDKGVTFAINFFNKRNRDGNISHLFIAQVKNILVPYISTYRPMLEYNENQIIVSDLKISQKQNILAFINTLKNEINRILMINSVDDTIGFSFGVVENKYFFEKIDDLLNTALELSNIAKDDDKTFLIYEDGKKVDSSNINLHFRTEVERIISDKKIKYIYRPIYNSASNRLVGYQANFELLDSFFDSMSELKAYASRTEDDKELFATISRNSISRFIQEKGGVTLRLFYPINFSEMPYVNSTFTYISSIKEANIVLVLNEDDFVDLSSENVDSIIDATKVFKSKGYEIGLCLNDNKISLSSHIYEIFDCFLLSTSSHVGDKKSQNRQLPSFQALIEKLLRYNKPIIATDIPTWSLMEYVIKLGVDIICGDSLAPYDENVLPLNSKIIAKIKNMRN